MASKYDPWVHRLDTGRWVVAEKLDGGRWCSRNTELSPGEELVVMGTLDELLAKVRTYANKNAAVKAFHRVYNIEVPDLPENMRLADRGRV